MLLPFEVRKCKGFHHSGTELKQRGHKQVLKYGSHVPGGVLQNCLVHNLAGWRYIPWVLELLHSYWTDLCLWIKGQLVCKIDLCSQISTQRSAKAYIRFSPKMMRLKCTLKCQYVLTHFTELGPVIVRSVLQKSYLLTLNILFILLLLGLPGREFRLTKMYLKLHFRRSHGSVFLSYLLYLYILKIDIEEISLKDEWLPRLLTLTKYFDKSYFAFDLGWFLYLS